jgi:hypothetical protein
VTEDDERDALVAAWDEQIAYIAGLLTKKAEQIRHELERGQRAYPSDT